MKLDVPQAEFEPAIPIFFLVLPSTVHGLETTEMAFYINFLLNCVFATNVSNQYGLHSPLAKEGNFYIGHNDALRLSLPYLINITGFPSQHSP
jgi:hypothetical protein